MRELKFKIEGMSCDGCSRTVEKKIAAVPGVISLKIDLAAALATVKVEEKNNLTDAIIAAVNSTGVYKAFLS